MKKLLAVTVSVVSVILLAGCRAEKAETVDLVTEVRCVEAVLASYADDLVSYGTVSFKTKNDVAALVDGNVSAVEVNEGDELRRGDVLLRLSNPQLMIQREQAQNAVDQARSALVVAHNKLWEARFTIESRLLVVERNEITIAQKELEAALLEANLDASRELFALGGVTRMSLEQQELSLKGAWAEMAVYQNDRRASELGLTAADLRSAGIVPASTAQNFREQVIGLNLRGNLAEVNAAELAAQNAAENLTAVSALVAALEVRAPVDGVVGARYYELGEYVKQNEKVVTLIDLTQVYAAFYIQEQDMVNFALGSPLSITVMSLDLTFGARIDEIAPMADSTSGNFAVKALLDNAGADGGTVLGSLRPGMFVRCVLPRGDGGECVTVPETALVAAKGAVFVVRNGAAVMLDVVLRPDSLRGGVVSVESGLKAGEQVIDKPSPFLRDGSAVVVGL